MELKKIQTNDMGEEGRKFVEENFSWKIITKKFVNNLKKTLDK